MDPLLPPDLVALGSDDLARVWEMLVDAVGPAEASRLWFTAFAATDAADT